MHPNIQAGIELLRGQDYLSPALLALHPIEIRGLGTMSADRHWRLYYDPVILDRTIPELATSIYHEVLHLLRDHHGRGFALRAKHYPWNVATDVEIGYDLFSEGRPFYHPPLLPSTFGWPSGLTAEEYYPLVKVETEPAHYFGGLGPPFKEVNAQEIRRQVALAVTTDAPDHLQVWADQLRKVNRWN